MHDYQPIISGKIVTFAGILGTQLIVFETFKDHYITVVVILAMIS